MASTSHWNKALASLERNDVPGLEAHNLVAGRSRSGLAWKILLDIGVEPDNSYFMRIYTVPIRNPH